MTPLLEHTVAQVANVDFRPKNQNNTDLTCGDKNHQNLIFKVNFQSQKSSEFFSNFFIEEYQFRNIFFVIDIF